MTARARAAGLALLTAALAARPAVAGAASPSALELAADRLAEALGPPTGDRRGLGLALDLGADALRRPLETALSGALARRGWAVAPLPPRGDAEAEARARGVDWLLRVRGGLVPSRRELALVGEAVPVWSSFFLQRRPGVRPAPPRLVSARADADAEALLLARPARPLDASRVVVRPLAELPGRVLALAAGEVEAGSAGIVAVRADAVLLLSPSGAPRSERALDATSRRPVRAPAATAAIGDFGGGRIAVAVAGAPAGEVLGVVGGALVPVGAIPGAPLCAGAAGPLFGRFVPGTSALADVLQPRPVADAAPDAPRHLIAAAAAPQAGPFAFAVVDADLRLAVLDAARAPAAPAQGGVGAGVALADLDGDGTAEVVASAPVPRAPDRVRVLAPRASTPLRFTSEPLPGLVLAGAAADLTGDGVDDAVLALVSTGADGAERTTLLLVTADGGGGESP